MAKRYSRYTAPKKLHSPGDHQIHLLPHLRRNEDFPIMPSVFALLYRALFPNDPTVHEFKDPITFTVDERTGDFQMVGKDKRGRPLEVNASLSLETAWKLRDLLTWYIKKNTGGYR